MFFKQKWPVVGRYGGAARRSPNNGSTPLLASQGRKGNSSNLCVCARNAASGCPASRKRGLPRPGLYMFTANCQWFCKLTGVDKGCSTGSHNLLHVMLSGPALLVQGSRCRVTRSRCGHGTCWVRQAGGPSNHGFDFRSILGPQRTAGQPAKRAALLVGSLQERFAT